ncbi:MAG: hypothetical protein P0Y60_15180 [Candidatus Microbacterium colombiense]|nr:MAG: hypothetical protein P0Y60_15180 [Microbacterium sp.]
MSGRPITGQTRQRMLAGAAGLALLLGLALVPPVQSTDASFTSSAYSGATITALKLQPPAVEPLPGGLTCPNPLSTILGGTALTIKWRWPTTPVGYPATSGLNVLLTGAADGTGGTIVAPGTPTAGVYTTTMSKGVLDGLLGGLGFLLGGGQYVVYFGTSWVTPGGVTWRSPQLVKITVTYAALLAGGATTCTFTTV